MGNAVVNEDGQQELTQLDWRECTDQLGVDDIHAEA